MRNTRRANDNLGACGFWAELTDATRRECQALRTDVDHVWKNLLIDIIYIYIYVYVYSHIHMIYDIYMYIYIYIFFDIYIYICIYLFSNTYDI